MRQFVVALLALSLFGVANIVRAYYDDSVVIEIEDFAPGSATSVTPAGITDTTSSGNIIFQSGGDSSSSGEVPAQDDSDALFDALVAQGAITGGVEEGTVYYETLSGAGGGELNVNTSGVSSSTSSVENSNQGDGSSDSSSLGSGGSQNGASPAKSGASITVDATKIRAALRDNDGFQAILYDFNASVRDGTYKKALSSHDVGLLAAGTMLGNPNIDEISFGASKFEIVYRSEGYLFALIPRSFPVHVAINPRATLAQDRVIITLPWYRFFLRKFFSTASLASEINTLVVADAQAHEKDIAAYAQARLFESVSRALQRKFGTVGGSIQGI
ncbi:hypothetical protein A3H16_03325 [Candidatus Kaiserbacteria bacterium RIFCSPLOWO2_12_FULL_53_8]|uniref:Uncharacterized protein n=2 Tax=Candidatus Kaiseribacteriota TaxID=1752734 RepID=A0A1F6CTL3_9BACT|nr:MAG: hypothetical protein A2851_00670 [Candidatus Kaiserbacteria bacterium RIFCSPHIGHO2_01_FULL_53_29]OGG91197.1 MAG: hypothetical protein A3H16_03325 [Candidatus Kaiserbacteria bacterium RIFCSPLOWO2_12_FULL_53_8]